MIALLFILLFQVNPDHPPVSVPLTRVEKQQLAKVPSYKFDDVDAAKKALIEQHYPAGQPKASWKPCTTGYRGHIYRPEDIIYTWDEPKCSR